MKINKITITHYFSLGSRKDRGKKTKQGLKLKKIIKKNSANQLHLNERHNRKRRSELSAYCGFPRMQKRRPGVCGVRRAKGNEGKGGDNLEVRGRGLSRNTPLNKTHGP